MSIRGRVWSIGLLITVSLVGILSQTAVFPELIVPTALLCLGLCALSAEIFSHLLFSLGPTRTALPPGARAADGRVDVVSMDGVEGKVLAGSSRFQCFLQIRKAPGETTRIDKLPIIQPKLLGRVALISLFVGRDGVRWTEEEISRGHEALERAGLWIEREASRYEAPVNIGLAATYFLFQDDEFDEVEVALANEEYDVGLMDAHASTKAVIAVSRAAASLGFADVVDLLGRINPRVDSEVRVWLLHLRRSGRSIAILAEECEVPGVGLAVCYSKEANFPEPLDGPGRVDPTTVVHELLHLFGASDKYGTPLRSFTPGSVSSRDIMRLNFNQLPRMTIDPLTASEIGWNHPNPANLLTKKIRRSSEKEERRTKNR